VVVPAVIPIITPELGSIVATDVLLLVHVPAAFALASVAVKPSHTDIEPVIAAKGLTVIFVVAVQPVGRVYVIVAVPATIPVTTPVAETTVATEVLLLLHVPPVDVLVNAIVKPSHTVDEPDMAAGSGLTVITAVLIQPVPNV
jgi:hypothetical protein